MDRYDQNKNGDMMFTLLSVLFACGESEKTEYDAYCNQDPEGTLIAEDADCDGVLTADDVMTMTQKPSTIWTVMALALQRL